MRGTRSNRRKRLCLYGIIPAHAGNTSPNHCPQSRYWDHPRTCGEHRPCARIPRSTGGSSPHMRGTRNVPDVPQHDPGIIPAHAGNTIFFVFVLLPAWDHPRTCGEHSPTLAAGLNTMGSSPHMRGTQHGLFRHGLHAGIIPAHAGNT